LFVLIPSPAHAVGCIIVSYRVHHLFLTARRVAGRGPKAKQVPTPHVPDLRAGERAAPMNLGSGNKPKKDKKMVATVL
jgi:hypothetical protein